MKGPEMLKWAGYTDRTDVFFFRDMSKKDILFGLFADGFGPMNSPSTTQLARRAGSSTQSRENSSFAEHLGPQRMCSAYVLSVCAQRMCARSAVAM